MTRPTKRPSRSAERHRLLTLRDHLAELRGRLFWVTAAFVAASALAYPNFDVIMSLLVRPLGDHQLYYMTPAGGLSFIIKVCLYVGIVAVLPAVVYHLGRFASPVMQRTRLRTVILYTATSSMLAMAGMAFAYLVSLPAALNFLTGITLAQVSDLLTIDSYLSFVMAYLIAGALLFQLPLLMLIVNRVTPLKPGRLLSFQRYIVVGSFVVAAILSPTPDVVNQAIMAVPMILMYQVGIMAIWIAQRSSRRSTTVVEANSQPARNVVASTAAAPPLSSSVEAVTPRPQVRAAATTRSIDGLTRARPAVSGRQQHITPARPHTGPRPHVPQCSRSLDGLLSSPA